MRLLKGALALGALLTPLAGLMFDGTPAQARTTPSFTVVGRYGAGLACRGAIIQVQAYVSLGAEASATSTSVARLPIVVGLAVLRQ